MGGLSCQAYSALNGCECLVSSMNVLSRQEKSAELLSLHFSATIAGIINSRAMKWAGVNGRARYALYTHCGNVGRSCNICTSSAILES